MINVEEYVRFRAVENQFNHYSPRKRVYLGVPVLFNEAPKPDTRYPKYTYFFHTLFGTIVHYGNGNIGKTPLCEQIDEEIVRENLKL